MADEQTYYAMRPCGCIQGVAHLIPTVSGTRGSASKLVGQWVRDGLSVHTLPESDSLPNWSCEEHKEKTNG